MDDESGGPGPPLHENQTLTEAGMGSGMRIIIEPGKVPMDSQVPELSLTRPATWHVDGCILLAVQYTLHILALSILCIY